uniref:Uncharacterized protein n=1 Tax=Glossina austeni TaxID=7395 RepID=A0A1A9V969_GLOAU
MRSHVATKSYVKSKHHTRPAEWSKREGGTHVMCIAGHLKGQCLAVNEIQLNNETIYALINHPRISNAATSPPTWEDIKEEEKKKKKKMQAAPTAATKANMPAVLKHNLTSSSAKWHRFHATSTSSQLKQLSQPRATLFNQKQQIMLYSLVCRDVWRSSPKYCRRTVKVEEYSHKSVTHSYRVLFVYCDDDDDEDDEDDDDDDDHDDDDDAYVLNS